MLSLRRFIVAPALGLAIALAFQLVTPAQDADNDKNRAGGVIASVSGNVISASKRNGTTVSIVVTESTTFVKNGQSATLADFGPGDFVKAAGSLDASGQFVATSVTGGEKGSKGGHRGGDKANKSGGQITAVDVTSGTVSVTRRRGAADTIRVSANTAITRNGQTATLSDLRPGEYVKARGSRDENGHLVADTIAGSDQRPQGRKAKPQS
jgi:hypothetical protein